jgi:hypothetical protein
MIKSSSIILLSVLATPAMADWPVAVTDQAVFHPAAHESITINVLGNDTGQGLTIKSVNTFSEKGARLYTTPNGSIFFSPTSDYDHIGEDGFWYEIEDDQGRTNSVRVSVDVKAESSTLPAPQEDYIEVPQGVSIRFDALKNDIFTPYYANQFIRINKTIGAFYDVNKWSQNGGKIEKVLVSSLNNSTNIDNYHLKYTPKAGFVGVDHFWYTVKDSTSDLSGTFPQFTKVTVNVLEDKTIRDPYPVANPDQVSGRCFSAPVPLITGDCTNAITTTNVLSNDIGKDLIVKLDSFWSLNGRPVNHTESSIVYSGDTSNVDAEDTVWYSIEDAYGRKNWSYLRVN